MQSQYTTITYILICLQTNKQHIQSSDFNKIDLCRNINKMASADVSGENSFLLQIERTRAELKEKVARAHQALQKRETALLSELQQLEDSYRGDKVAEQIQELSLTKEQTISTLQREDNQELIEPSVAQLDARMGELEATLGTTRDRMRRVELGWDGNLEEILSKTGSIRVGGVNQIMVAGKHRDMPSSTPGDFYWPYSIAVNSETKNIYICDSGNNRVQVFNDSLKFLFAFSDKMDRPVGICIYLDVVYITQFSGHYFTVYSPEGRHKQSVGVRGDKKLEFQFPRGVAVSAVNSLIYICDKENQRIHCLNLDLSFNSFILNVAKPIDIKVTPQNIVVLKSENPCIQFYEYTHQLVREMIAPEANLVNCPSFFCLDTHSNILMTDSLAGCVFVIFNDGRLGRKREDLNYPTGIAINKHNGVIVVSHSPEHCIQLL